jgi:hypothetical protein
MPAEAIVEHTAAMKTTKRPPDSGFGWPQFVAASAEEIRYAEELRRQIERRYLGQAQTRVDGELNTRTH